MPSLCPLTSSYNWTWGKTHFNHANNNKVLERASQTITVANSTALQTAGRQFFRGTSHFCTVLQVKQLTIFWSGLPFQEHLCSEHWKNSVSLRSKKQALWGWDSLTQEFYHAVHCTLPCRSLGSGHCAKMFSILVTAVSSKLSFFSHPRMLMLEANAEDT